MEKFEVNLTVETVRNLMDILGDETPDAFLEALDEAQGAVRSGAADSAQVIIWVEK